MTISVMLRWTTVTLTHVKIAGLVSGLREDIPASVIQDLLVRELISIEISPPGPCC